VEAQVIDWFKKIIGMPKEASGLLTSGASTANFIGLAVARNAMAGIDVRKHGMQCDHPPMKIYASSEAHFSIERAIHLLGLGEVALRIVDVNERYEMELSKLQQAIDEDRKLGYHPICVVASAGNINTGSIDPLDEIAALCEQQQLWMHVDGAIGAPLALSAKHHGLIKGISKADSVAMDLHKWLHAPFEVGMALIRREKEHLQTFAADPEYIAHTDRGIASGNLRFCDYGLQLSREFKALKIWLSIKEQGLDKFGRVIDQNIAQAKYLAALIAKEPQLELMAPLVINILCLRFHPANFASSQLDSLNQEILLRLHERGVAVPSYTVLAGHYGLRIAITNFRTRKEDLDFIVSAIVSVGEEIVKERSNALHAGTTSSQVLSPCDVERR
jgi:glutamate/tyrosine decarboxylase-like PLP-dependent enzyme